MMLPFRRRSNPPPSPPAKPASETIQLKTEIIEPSPQHLDYDLHPLNVEGLSHYMEPVADEGRFRVH